LLRQQEKFDHFIKEFNSQRPRQAIDTQYPCKRYHSSPRPYQGIQELTYPFHDRTITVTNCGRICIKKRKVNLSRVFAGQDAGVKKVNDRIWLVSFTRYDLGCFDLETKKIEPLQYPFAPERV